VIELPGVLAQIANVAGDDAALAIAQARGGTQIYVPPLPGPDHWLSKLVGLEAARAIADELTGGFAGARIDLPLGPAGHAAQMRAKMDAMIAQGRSERDIAMATRYSTRTIRRRRAQLDKPDDNRQLSFF
jgi:hypothetical protein